MKINGIDGLAIGGLLATTMLVSGGYASLGHKDGAIVRERNQTLSSAMYLADVGERPAYTSCNVPGNPTGPNGSGGEWPHGSLCNCGEGTGAPPYARLHECKGATKVWTATGGGLGTCSLKPCRTWTGTAWYPEGVAIMNVSSATCTAYDLDHENFYGGVCDE